MRLVWLMYMDDIYFINDLSVLYLLFLDTPFIFCVR